MATPHKKAPTTKLPQVHVVQELLPSVHDLLLLKEKMIANRVPFRQDVVPRPLQNSAGIVVDKSGTPERKEKVNGFKDSKNGGGKDVLEESRKDRKAKKKKKKKLGSRTTEQLPSPESSWLPETEDSQNNPSYDGSNTKEESYRSGIPPEKVPKLSPALLGEILHDTPTLHLSSQTQSPPLAASPSLTSPTRHTKPTTTSLIATGSLPFARPKSPAQEQTLSAPPSIRRSKSFHRELQLDTQTSHSTRLQVSQQQGPPAENGGNTMSPQKSSTLQSSVDSPGAHTLSPKSAKPIARSSSQNCRDSIPPPPTHPPTTTHLLKSATSAPSPAFPPLPLQTYLSLALASPTSYTPPSTSHSSQKPGPTQSTNTHDPPQNHPDDSAAIAFERITNFLILPGKLEGALWFGMLACLDSWLYMFTILPLRFVRALGVLCAFWWGGIKGSLSWGSKTKSEGSEKRDHTPINAKIKRAKRVSDLQPSHKADILRGLVVFTSCWILMRFDASRMYHFIRGQSGIKLYVMYNMLEVWTPGQHSHYSKCSEFRHRPICRNGAANSHGEG